MYIVGKESSLEAAQKTAREKKRGVFFKGTQRENQYDRGTTYIFPQQQKYFLKAMQWIITVFWRQKKTRLESIKTWQVYSCSNKGCRTNATMLIAIDVSSNSSALLDWASRWFHKKEGEGMMNTRVCSITMKHFELQSSRREPQLPITPLDIVAHAFTLL